MIQETCLVLTSHCCLIEMGFMLVSAGEIEQGVSWTIKQCGTVPKRSCQPAFEEYLQRTKFSKLWECLTLMLVENAALTPLKFTEGGIHMF